MLRDLGAQHRRVEVDSPRIPFLADWQLTKQLVDIFRDWQPQVAMGFGLRPMMDAAIAARRAKVKRVVSLCNGLPREGVAVSSQRRFAHAMRASDAVIFHNQDDQRRVTAAGLIPEGLPDGRGAGSRCRPSPLRHEASPASCRRPRVPHDRAPRAIRAASWNTRVAARDLKARANGARFLLAGPLGKGPDAVTHGRARRRRRRARVPGLA